MAWGIIRRKSIYVSFPITIHESYNFSRGFFMPVDRHIYIAVITKNAAPNWRCPTCAAGHLRLDKDSVTISLTAETEAAKSEEYFFSDMVDQRFVAMLKCDNPGCRESSVVAGKGRVDEEPDEKMENLEYVDVLMPTYVNPSPLLIEIPKRCPDKVVEELREAFVASWSDFPAAGNHIRTAAEYLLDALGANKTNGKKGAALRFLSLHARIKNLKAKHQNVRDELMAIKWLGNAGSHIGALTRESVFDALDIFEAVLRNLYLDHPRKLKKLVQLVNKRKGPSRKSAKRAVAF